MLTSTTIEFNLTTCSEYIIVVNQKQTKSIKNKTKKDQNVSFVFYKSVQVYNECLPTANYHLFFIGKNIRLRHPLRYLISCTDDITRCQRHFPSFSVML